MEPNNSFGPESDITDKRNKMSIDEPKKEQKMRKPRH